MPTPAYTDFKDDSCTPPKGCAGGTIPAERGLCVETAAGKYCWDACNTAHQPLEYGGVRPVPDPNPEIPAGLAIMVKEFRTGYRGILSCPNSKMAATCNPGQRCTPAGLTLYRGMCVQTPPNGNQCLDMCDTSISLVATKDGLPSFHDTPGKMAGTVNMVQQVRAGRDPQGYTTCPGLTVWAWLWFPILLCCLVGFCGGAYWMFQYYRQRLKKQKEKVQNYEPDTPFVEDGAQYAQYDQVQPQDNFNDPMPVAYPEQQPMLEKRDEPVTMPMVPPLAPVALPQQNMFGTPNLAAGSSFARGPGMSGIPAYPQAGSMALSNAGVYAAPYGAYGTQFR